MTSNPASLWKTSKTLWTLQASSLVVLSGTKGEWSHAGASVWQRVSSARGNPLGSRLSIAPSLRQRKPSIRVLEWGASTLATTLTWMHLRWFTMRATKHFGSLTGFIFYLIIFWKGHILNLKNTRKTKKLQNTSKKEMLKWNYSFIRES